MATYYLQLNPCLFDVTLSILADIDRYIVQLLPGCYWMLKRK